jgi:hypothetical protein
VLSLLFDPAVPPDAPAIRRLAGRNAEFSISHDPAQDGKADEGGWLELLANGLTYDLHGLPPGTPLAPGHFRHRFDLRDSFEPSGFTALSLQPGPHLAGGETMLPVVRSQAWLATQLCALPGIAAVGWAPARSVCSVAHFTASVRRWLEGGVFPALGLTALNGTSDGGLQSEGLAFFTGQELRIEPEVAADKAGAARLGVRLINELVGRGKLAQAEQIVGPDGERLTIAPSENGRYVRVWLDGG